MKNITTHTIEENEKQLRESATIYMQELDPEHEIANRGQVYHAYKDGLSEGMSEVEQLREENHMLKFMHEDVNEAINQAKRIEELEEGIRDIIKLEEVGIFIPGSKLLMLKSLLTKDTKNK